MGGEPKAEKVQAGEHGVGSRVHLRAAAQYEVSRHALIGPVKTFFTEFRTGDPAPDLLSRHVVAHAPTETHFNQANVVIALMLATSILREQQECCEEVRATDAVDEC